MIHVYCGDGKGKTTAALGLILRHVGAGGRAVLAQFLKSAPTGELATLERLGVPVEPVEAAGWAGDVIEAQTFGYLAIRSVKGLALSLPGTTGVPQPLTGGRLNLPG